MDVQQETEQETEQEKEQENESRSKVKPLYAFTRDRWVVSKIVARGQYGGHAKIIIEGLNDDPGWTDKQGAVLYVAEYHIIPHANPKIKGRTLPPNVSDEKHKFGIRWTERSKYKAGKAEQYASAASKSWQVKKARAMEMLKAIDEEWLNHNAAYLFNNDQYAGTWRLVGSSSAKSGNCSRWCDKKLKLAGITPSVVSFTPAVVLRFVGHFKTAPLQDAPLENKDNNASDSEGSGLS